MNSYVVKHKDLATRLASRSGGIFTAVSDKILEAGGFVYGCKLNDKFMAEHAKAVTVEERNQFRGSKYIQSDKKLVFKDIKADLGGGHLVLFSGTSCEVAGLLKYLGKNAETDNLITIDIVCHGVPSPLVWNKYLDYCKDKVKDDIESVQFRNKIDFGWASNFETIKFRNGDVINSRDFNSIFNSHYCLRPSCYHCPYKKITHPGDLTIADCWGIGRNKPEFNDNKGVSLVLVNTIKGKKLFNRVTDDILFFECDIKDYMQQSFVKPYKVNESNRKRFWNYIHNKPFCDVVNTYGNSSIEEKTKRILHKILPSYFIHRLKTMLGR